MFRKKKKHTLINNLDDTRETAYDFRRRLTVFESYRPSEYRMTPKLEEDVVMPMLETHLEKLFAGEIDDANGDVLDRLIFAGAREGKPYLALQHYEHKDLIARLVARWKSDYKDLKNLREFRGQELEELLADHKATCKLLEKDIHKEVSE